MPIKNHSDGILSEYFRTKTKMNELIPYMPVISRETGLSNATISRYSKKKGFYNFGEFRAKFNKSLEINHEPINTNEMNELFNYKSIKVVTSKSTEVIGNFLKGRLEFLTDVELVNKNTTWHCDDLTIFITLSAESKRIQEAVLKSKGKKILITTVINPNLPKSVKQIALPEFKVEIRKAYDIWNSILKVMNWINNRINIQQIKIENSKEK